MKPVVLVGAGPSLTKLSEQDRARLQHLDTIATSAFVRWSDAWKPTAYVVNDFGDLGSITAEVDARWPDVERYYQTVPVEYKPVAGWSWFPRRYQCRLETGDWCDEHLVWAHNPVWYTAQIAARLGRGWDTFVLLGVEHTSTGYAHDPSMPHDRDLAISRREAKQLEKVLAARGIRLVDASGPESTLQIPRGEMGAILNVAMTEV